MRIAIVVKEFPPDIIGGTETQTKRMATELQDHGHDVTVFTKKYGRHDDSDVSFDVVRVRNLRWNPFISTLTFLFFCLIAVVRRSKRFDVLQCMMVYPNGFLGYVNKRITGLPYFAWIRGGDYYFMKDIWWKRWMIRKVLEDTLVVAQSPETKEDVHEDFPDINANVGVLGNGVEVPEIPDDSDEHGSEYVLFLGRLAELKGLKYLIEAAQDINSTVVIVGDGDQRSELEELANELKVDVRFEGHVDPENINEYYQNASVFVYPSIEGEGLPNSVLEAMASGLPVVATDSGGLPTLIEDDETGYIVPMRDSDSLAQRINQLLENTERRIEIGRRAREYVIQNHSWDRIVDELENIYDRVI